MKTDIKANKKQLHCLLNAVAGERSLDFDGILKHELSTVLPSLAKAGSHMNTSPTC